MTTDPSTARENAAVFLGEPAVEKAGHVGFFASTPDRLSHCTCSCGWETTDVAGAEYVLTDWRNHIGAAS